MSDLTHYEQALMRRDYSPRTARIYTICVRHYVEWMQPQERRPVSSQRVRRFLLHLRDTGYSRSYIDQHVAALRLLYHELPSDRDADLLDGLYTDLHGGPPGAHSPATLPLCRPPEEPSPPRPERIEQLSGVIPERPYQLAVLLMYAAGLRVDSVVAADVADVDTLRAKLWVEDRAISISPALVRELEAQNLHRDYSAPLLEEEGQRLCAGRLQRVLKQAIRRKELPRWLL